MEAVLRGQKAPEVGLQFFPVRHHSPACAYHLKKMIADYKPQAILIEGPENAGELIPLLTDQGTKMPVALYYFYKDRKKLLDEEGRDYRCYYPFLDYSPELVALREGKKRGIETRFIDLPYSEILLGTAAKRGIRSDEEQQNYNDDYLLSRSRYLNALCEKTGLREFGELWEKYFEIDGLYISTEEFVERMRLWCDQAREQTPREEMEGDGCLLREQYMAEQIRKALGEFERVLVVTGGFHTPGLEVLLGIEKAVDGEDAGCAQIGLTSVKLHNIAPPDQGVYMLAYSMEATDALNGYASGMQSPGFYQKVWEHLMTENPWLEEKRSAYEWAVLHQLVTAGRQARKQKEPISSADIIGALSMARGLAALRGKKDPGLYELRDGALSSFVKGECNPSTDMPLRILHQVNTGSQVGTVCAGTPRPPILNDFEEQCKKFNLKLQASLTQEVTLEIFGKAKHLEASRFLYRMEFLETGFARKIKGADLLSRRDKSRIREVWNYRYSGDVLAALIDVSMAGGTVEEAARNRLNRTFFAVESVRAGARLMTRAFLMGYLEDQAAMEDKLAGVIAADGDFFSLTEGFSHLKMLYELQGLYQIEASRPLEQLLELCFGKIIQRLPGMAAVKDEQLQETMEACLNLYQMTGAQRFSDHRQMLVDALQRLTEKSDIHPGLLGAVLGLLYGNDGAWGQWIEETAAGYLQGTADMRMESAVFLRGLFCTARDFVFVNEPFLVMIDELVAQLSGEQFLEMLPELRRAFSYFTPLEIDRVAKRAAQMHGVSKKQVTGGMMVSPKLFEYGRMLDRLAREEAQL